MSSDAAAALDSWPLRGSAVWRAAAEEYRRFVGLIGDLTPEDWSAQTDCERWDVRLVALHVLGATEANASPRELAHQFRRGLALNRRIDAHHWVDGINEVQIRDRAGLTTGQIVDRMAQASMKAVRGRRLTPPPFRWLPIPFGPPIGWKPLTYLLRVGFTRDVWMHRIDIVRATGRDLVLTPDHDGRLVAGIVAEWASIHGQPFTATLAGPAGGVFRYRSGGEAIEVDAIDFCRILSGRGEGSGLLTHKLPL